MERENWELCHVPFTKMLDSLLGGGRLSFKQVWRVLLDLEEEDIIEKKGR